MVKSRPSQPHWRESREVAAQGGKIVARRFSPDSGLLDFAALEQVAAAAAAGWTEGTLAVLLDQQAAALGAEHPGPDCGRACPVQHQDRLLTVIGGTHVLFPEPPCHCPDCRRDFVPPPRRPGA